MLTESQRRQLLGLAILALALFVGLSLIPVSLFGDGARALFPDGNIMGVLGAAIARVGFGVFGAGILLVPVVLVLSGARLFGRLEHSSAGRWAAFLAGLAFLLPAIAALWADNAQFDNSPFLPEAAAGWIGRTLALPLVALLGIVGALITFVILLIGLTIATLGWPERREHEQGDVLPDEPQPIPAFVGRASEPEPEAVSTEGDGVVKATARALTDGARAALNPLRAVKKAAKSEHVLEDTGNPGSDDRPPVHLLSEGVARDHALSASELDRLGEVLIQTLRTFKVEGQIAGRTTGPVVTQFEVVPAPGVKVNRIAALDADLALALRAPSIRIVAPIPGKGAVGVEVPNPEPDTVYLRPLLETAAFQKARGTLPLALGRDLTGKPYVADLARMPHLLIAGATGSGKSICINTLITSLIYRHSPRSLRLLMVDPKMVELSMYADLPHLRHPVVTHPQDAATVLKWAVMEMERRYALLSVNGTRSLAEFNQRVNDEVPLKRAEPVGDEDDPERWTYTEGPLPYIVVVVDELADLMMTVQAEIEKPLAQLAQKARAIGIHLIVATQRPSVNVITGLIKANFPCRIGFRVSSKVDSRTILDQNGADALLGNGDMLFLPPGTSDPVRIQGAYLSTEDTERLMSWYREQAIEEPRAEDDILEYVRSREASADADDQLDMIEERDELFRQAAEICMQHNQGSTSLLQRRLRVGYGRAARIIDQLHNAGILGPPDGSKPREVLVGMESLEHVLGED
ncbi:MAG TPA: DNA translocase FtsK 4TM domain-containing protein [Longimicrobiales bacterium]|nr:DNA translocase FtsK 4TM domain-containing protein [Longimicrobiales bacterium]